MKTDQRPIDWLVVLYDVVAALFATALGWIQGPAQLDEARASASYRAEVAILRSVAQSRDFHTAARGNERFVSCDTSIVEEHQTVLCPCRTNDPSVRI